jgi:hypothetical protein
VENIGNGKREREWWMKWGKAEEFFLFPVAGNFLAGLRG